MYTRITQIFSRKTFVFSCVNFSTRSLSLSPSLCYIYQYTKYISSCSVRTVTHSRISALSFRDATVNRHSVTIVKSRSPLAFEYLPVRERSSKRLFSKKKKEVLREANIFPESLRVSPEISFKLPTRCLRRGWLNRRMFFGHWEYIEEGGKGEDGHGAEFLLLYGDQSSRMISTFPSTAMPRELYAITHIHIHTHIRTHTHTREKERRENRERTPESGKMVPKLCKCVK